MDEGPYGLDLQLCPLHTPTQSMVTGVVAAQVFDEDKKGLVREQNLAHNMAHQKSHNVELR